MALNKESVFMNQRGAAMIIALVMMVILTLIGLASTFTSTFEIMLSGNKRGATDAFYAADSGVNVISARVENFDKASYDPSTNRYDPFTDAGNINPTSATASIEFFPGRHGPPRGLAYGTQGLDYEHFLIDSTGRDQIESSSNKSTSTVRQKVVRLLPVAE